MRPINHRWLPQMGRISSLPTKCLTTKKKLCWKFNSSCACCPLLAADNIPTPQYSHYTGPMLAVHNKSPWTSGQSTKQQKVQPQPSAINPPQCTRLYRMTLSSRQTRILSWVQHKWWKNREGGMLHNFLTPWVTSWYVLPSQNNNPDHIAPFTMRIHGCTHDGNTHYW